jgi:arginyl-tRNA synthetase
MRDLVISAISQHVREDVPITVSIPDVDTHGHFSTNLAFRLSKIRGKSPALIADELSHAMKSHPLFSHVEVAGNGFINMWISTEALTNELHTIITQKKKYGTAKKSKKEQRHIQIEFISANPTGPLTLANGRGGFLGDVLANVLIATGHKVEREYYVNDTGNQVRTLGASLLATQGIIPEEEKFYKGSYIKEWALAHASLVKKHRGNPEKLGAEAAKYFLKSISSVIEKKAHIHFDRYTSEKRDIHNKKYVEKALALFKEKSLTYEEGGATWLRTTEFHDDKDRVLVTKEGLPTYFLADAGHYLETVERGFASKIIILGPDHYGYVSRLQAAASIVGLPDSKVIITQAVRLMRGGVEAKMSKRKGEFVTFEELVDEVGADAARFFFVMISPDTHMDFDLDLAKEHSLKNPVYYVQYAYVRAESILKKAKIKRGVVDYSLLNSKEDIQLMRLLGDFPDVAGDVAAQLSVHHLAKYVLDVAKAFHAFYEHERVEGVDAPLARARGVLVQATIVVLHNALHMLGVSTPKKM